MFAQTMDQMNSTLLNYFSPSWVMWEKIPILLLEKQNACSGYFMSLDCAQPLKPLSFLTTHDFVHFDPTVI